MKAFFNWLYTFPCMKLSIPMLWTTVNIKSLDQVLCDHICSGLRPPMT
jgi:hypothetical protein